MVILNIFLALVVLVVIVGVVAAGIRFDHRHRGRLNRAGRRFRRNSSRSTQ
jgi:hypothetical protein